MTQTAASVSLVLPSHLCALMLPCIMAFGSRLDCWLGGCTPTPPFTPMEFPPEEKTITRSGIHPAYIKQAVKQPGFLLTHSVETPHGRLARQPALVWHVAR